MHKVNQRIPKNLPVVQRIFEFVEHSDYTKLRVVRLYSTDGTPLTAARNASGNVYLTLTKQQKLCSTIGEPIHSLVSTEVLVLVNVKQLCFRVSKKCITTHHNSSCSELLQVVFVYTCFQLVIVMFLSPSFIT